MAQNSNYRGNGKSDYSKDGKNLPQYGKKGHKPRIRDERPTISLDDIRTNDISYWNKTESFQNVTKFNWDLVIGRNRDLKSTLFPNITADSSSMKFQPPQIMMIDFYMGPGYAAGINDGVNRGLAKIMAKIRASLSTSNIGFETADLGILLASTSSIAAMIGLAKRILESYTVWKDKNYVYPRAILKAQGIDYADIMANINKYAATLNAYIDQYNAMNLLDAFDLYDRQYSMCHNIFVDEDSEYGQLYMFKPMNFYQYNDSATPAYAGSQPLNYSNFTDLLGRINTAIQFWYSSSDLYQINGTLLRAFKDAPRQSIPHYNMSDTITPVVDRAFLMQIMNMTICGRLKTYSLDITQDGSTQNFVIWKPHCTVMPDPRAPKAAEANFALLRLFENNVSEEDNMELTRLINFSDKTSGEMVNCGSEIVTNVRIFSYDASTDTVDWHSINDNFTTLSKSSPALIGQAVKSWLMAQPFRYLPTLMCLWDPGDTIPFTQYLGLAGDMYNWMLYPREDWQTLQFVAYQSLWTPKNL